jgi:hypothetical protein
LPPSIQEFNHIITCIHSYTHTHTCTHSYAVNHSLIHLKKEVPFLLQLPS